MMSLENNPAPSTARLSLRFKATLMVLGMLTVALLGGDIVAIVSMRAQSFQDHGRATEAAARGLSIASRVALFSGDKEELKRLGTDLLADPTVSFVALLDGRGRVVSESVRDVPAWERVTARLGLEGITSAPTVVDDVCVASAPVAGLNSGDVDIGLLDGAKGEPDSSGLGKAIVGLSTGPLAESIRWRTALLSGLFGLVALGTVPVVWLTVGRWTTRLGRLVRASERIARGSLDDAVTDDRRDEIGSLVRAFELMRSSVKLRDQELRGMNETLHTQVHERTSELSRRSEELEIALAKAEAASRAKSDFLANMSHEIRTPMTAILGFADILHDPALPEETRADAVRTIRRSGDHLLTILNDILDISKIEAGRLDVSRQRTPLVPIVSEVVSLLRVRASAKGLALVLSFHGPMPAEITTDPQRLRQILMNLIGNAVKFTSAGGVNVDVTMLGEPSAARVHVVVRDTGIGMTPEQVGKLFRPFTQGDETMSRRFGGTGLGLAIARRLTEFLGGSISARSTKDAGSRFEFQIDAGDLTGVGWIQGAREAGTYAPAPKDPAAPPTLRGRILLAEDGPDNQRLISFHLRRAGAEVVIVDNGRLAVEAATAAERDGSPFSVVLMDMQMPEMDGYSAAGALRSGAYPRPIIALTAHAMSGDRERCLRAGCSDYLTKPVDRAGLLRACARWSGPGAAAAAA